MRTITILLTCVFVLATGMAGCEDKGTETPKPAKPVGPPKPVPTTTTAPGVSTLPVTPTSTAPATAPATKPAPTQPADTKPAPAAAAATGFEHRGSVTIGGTDYNVYDMLVSPTPAAARPATAPAAAPTTAPAPPEPAPPSTKSGREVISPRFLAMARADLDAGMKYLLSHQNADGGWGNADPDAEVPVSLTPFTALVLKVLVQHPDYTSSTPEVAKGYAFVLKSVQDNGGIYNPKQGWANYTTSVSVMALVAAEDPKFAPVIAAAVKYLKGIQIKDGDTTPSGEKITGKHPFVGGTSYGKHGRPDLSNLSLTISALHDAGVPKDDPFFANAVIFLSRTQNRTESNDQPWVVTNDGGYVYAPRDLSGNPESKALTVTVDGRTGPRSYGSMTYAGFMSMLYANVARDDPRIRAAFEWIRKHWRLDSNPNMPQAQSKEGLFYYYHVFAKALRAWGQDEIADFRGEKHNWREELIEMLHAQRAEDGSWVNAQPRWLESDPVLVTAYVTLALQECLK